MTGGEVFKSEFNQSVSLLTPGFVESDTAFIITLLRNFNESVAYIMNLAKMATRVQRNIRCQIPDIIGWEVL
jgi:hypothetical protein